MQRMQKIYVRGAECIENGVTLAGGELRIGGDLYVNVSPDTACDIVIEWRPPVTADVAASVTVTDEICETQAAN